MKIAAVVILYQPGVNVIDNIASYHHYVDKVFVYDNTESSTSRQDAFTTLPKVEYFGEAVNEGVAKRLNQALERAWQDGYDWLLTMDQDTQFSEMVIKQYFSCIQHFPQKDNVAMFGTRYSKHLQQSTADCAFEEVENLITSGTVLNLQLAKTIGRFDEQLFIDSVDHDYVIRARAQSFKIIRFSHLFLVHHLGNEVYRASIKTLFIKKKKKIVHSALRCYYMYRNMLYLKKKHQDKSVFLAGRLQKVVTGNLMANFFYGRNAMAMLRYLVKARKDFKHNRMGKINTPSDW